jgi:heterotetrameric sarcosine oxidase gamma subunit
VTDARRVTIDFASASAVHALEIWGAEAVGRVAALLGFPLPPSGRTAGNDHLRAIRVEPAVWLVDGAGVDPAGLAEALGDDGALTAIGGGLVRVRITGPDWRALLMAEGVFDAEDPAFAPGCAAATIIAHVAVRLHVIDAETCEAFVPASYATGLIHGWSEGAKALASLGRP